MYFLPTIKAFRIEKAMTGRQLFWVHLSYDGHEFMATLLADRITQIVELEKSTERDCVRKKARIAPK